ncbi:MAG: ribonuclease HII [Thalassobaculales bacterium]
MPPDLALEAALAARFGGPVAGVDEVGRGPLAGPVVAAAVILDRARLPAGIDDSKRLPAALRLRLAAEIRATALVGVGAASVAEIARLNILGASLLAMARAVARLPRPPAACLVDGNRAPALACPAECVVGGDGLSLSIAAASIIAKVLRDRLMARLDRRHPGYGWAGNAGYPTAAHRAAIGRLGITPHHRQSFRLR